MSVGCAKDVEDVGQVGEGRDELLEFVVADLAHRFVSGLGVGRFDPPYGGGGASSVGHKFSAHW